MINQFGTLPSQVYLAPHAGLPLRNEVNSLYPSYANLMSNYWFPRFQEIPSGMGNLSLLAQSSVVPQNDRLSSMQVSNYAGSHTGTPELSNQFSNSPEDFSVVPARDAQTTNCCGNAASRSKLTWREEHFEIMKSIVVQYKSDWKRIVKRFFRLTGLKVSVPFLKKKFKEATSTENLLKRVKFSHEEDLLIVRSVLKYGLDWEKISQYLPGRSPMMIKNRFYSHIKKGKTYESLVEEVKANNLEEELETSITADPQDLCENDSVSWIGESKLKIFSEVDENEACFFVSMRSLDGELNERITASNL